jgi:hypothetical protein
VGVDGRAVRSVRGRREVEQPLRHCKSKRMLAIGSRCYDVTFCSPRD